MTNLEARIAADTARYREFLAAAEAGDRYAQMNAEIYAARLKRLGAMPVTAAPAPTSAPAPKIVAKPQPVSREQAIERLAAAHGIPDEMSAAAIADGTPADVFALAVAEHAIQVKREAEIDAVARRIVAA